MILRLLSSQRKWNVVPNVSMFHFERCFVIVHLTHAHSRSAGVLLELVREDERADFQRILQTGLRRYFVVARLTDIYSCLANWDFCDP